MSKILVIGAQNIDIFAKSEKELVEGDSNPAKINIAFGGVGRNIAVNMKRLGHEVHFLSVFGDDIISNSAIQRLHELDVEIKESLFLKNTNSSIYLALQNQENNLQIGFHDMTLMLNMTPDYLQSKMNFIQGFEFIIIDNNLQIKSIKYLLERLNNKTVVMDAVSAYKAPNLNNFEKISILKLNLQELNVLSKEKSVEKQLNELHNMGVKTILLSNQEKESIVSIGDKYFSKKPNPIETIINTSGAGDAFLCGYLHGLILKKSEEDRLKMANFAAGVTLSSNESTSLQLSSELLEKAIDE